MRRVFRWFAILGPALLAGLMLWTVALGSLAETPRDPVETSKPHTQIIDDADLGRAVRGVIDLPVSLEAVWDVLTDPAQYGSYCPCLREPVYASDPDRTTRLTGRVQGWANTFPLDVMIRQEQHLHENVATWDGSSEDVPVNRGRWTVRRLGPTSARAEVVVAVEVRGVPVCFTRLLLRKRLAEQLTRLAHARSEW